MRIPRAIYFLFYAGSAFLVPYLALHYQSLGLSGSQIGILAGIIPIISMIGAPAWGAAADVNRQHKRLLVFALGFSAFSALLFARVDDYLVLVGLVAFYAFVTAPIMPLVDNSVVELLGSRKADYGLQRVWGSYGWGAAGLASGWIVGQAGLKIIFPIYAFFLGIALLAASRFQVKEVSIGIHLRRELRKLFTNRGWLLFMGLVWAAGVGLAMVYNFYFIYLKEIGTPDWLFGVALAMGIISEIPVMLYSNRLLKRFDAGGLLIIATAIIIVRNLAYSLAREPWQAVALQLLQGPTFALIWVAGVEYASQIAPIGMGATAQGVFSGVFSGFGFACGALLGGTLYGAFGIRSMFQFGTALVLAALILFIVLSYFGNRSALPRQPG